MAWASSSAISPISTRTDVAQLQRLEEDADSWISTTTLDRTAFFNNRIFGSFPSTRPIR